MQFQNCRVVRLWYPYHWSLHSLMTGSAKWHQNMSLTSVNSWSRKKVVPVFLVVVIAHHTLTLVSCNGTSWSKTGIFCRSVPVALWIDISNEMKPVFIAKQRVSSLSLYHANDYWLSTSLYRYDVSVVAWVVAGFLRQPSSIYYLTGSDQRYGPNKLRTPFKV